MNLVNLPSRVHNWIRWKFALDRPAGDAFLSDVSGVIHVGANEGQERMEYASRGLRVLWVEPIPAVFEKLKKNIRFFPFQQAAQYLLTDLDGQSHVFKIASNGGASSSIFDMAEHGDIWPDIHYVDEIHLTSTTLKSMIDKNNIDMARYSALVMDVQGSELLVLKGAGEYLRRFRYIKAEAADFNCYSGGCQIDELIDYLKEFGFEEFCRTRFAERPDGKAFYDVVFKNVDKIGIAAI